MALQKDFEYKGISINNCYFRVWNPSFPSKNTMSFGVSCHVNPDAPMLDSSTYSCVYALNSGNPWEQAYAYLKTLPEFAGAVDC